MQPDIWRRGVELNLFFSSTHRELDHCKMKSGGGELVGGMYLDSSDFPGKNKKVSPVVCVADHGELLFCCFTKFYRIIRLRVIHQHPTKTGKKKLANISGMAPYQ